MAANLLEQANKTVIEEEGESDDDDDDEADDKSAVPTAAQGMSEEYKLFEVVTSAFPKQVIRYIQPNQRANLEPLWTSDKNKLLAKDIPKCKNCGAVR